MWRVYNAHLFQWMGVKCLSSFANHSSEKFYWYFVVNGIKGFELYIVEYTVMSFVALSMIIVISKNTNYIICYKNLKLMSFLFVCEITQASARVWFETTYPPQDLFISFSLSHLRRIFSLLPYIIRRWGDLKFHDWKFVCV